MPVACVYSFSLPFLSLLDECDDERHVRASAGHIRKKGSHGCKRSRLSFLLPQFHCNQATATILYGGGFQSSQNPIRRRYLVYLLVLTYSGVTSVLTPGPLARLLLTTYPSFHIVACVCILRPYFRQYGITYYVTSRSQSYLDSVSAYQVHFDPIEFSPS